FLAGECVPDLHGVVTAPRGDPGAVRAEGRGTEPARVPFKGTDQLAGARVPYLYLVPAGSNEPFAVRAERHFPSVCPPFEREEFAPGAGGPGVRLVARRREPLAVRAERHALDVSRGPSEGPDLLAGQGVPEGHPSGVGLPNPFLVDGPPTGGERLPVG